MVQERDELALETRRKLYELVERYPGLHFREIVRRSGMSASNVDYHLRFLIKHERISVVQDGRYKRYYPKGKLPPGDRKIMTILRRENLRGIILYLLLNPGSTYHQLSEAFDFSLSQLSNHLQTLIKKNIIIRVQEVHVQDAPPQDARGETARSSERTSRPSTRNHQTRYYVAEEERIASMIIAYRPAFRDVLVEAFADAWTGRKRRKNRRKKQGETP